MPAVAAMPTYPFLPKSLTRRFTNIAVRVLDWWIAQVRVASTCENRDESLASTLFLKYLDFLVSRNASEHFNQKHDLTEPPVDQQIRTAQIIRLRIQRLEAGFWLDELDAALLDVKTADSRSRQKRANPIDVDLERCKETQIRNVHFQELE